MCEFQNFLGPHSLVHFGAPYGGQGCRVAVTRDTRVVRWDQGRGDMDIADAATANDAQDGQPRFLGV